MREERPSRDSAPGTLSTQSKKRGLGLNKGQSSTRSAASQRNRLTFQERVANCSEAKSSRREKCDEKREVPKKLNRKRTFLDRCRRRDQANNRRNRKDHVGRGGLELVPVGRARRGGGGVRAGPAIRHSGQAPSKTNLDADRKLVSILPDSKTKRPCILEGRSFTNLISRVHFILRVSNSVYKFIFF